jgi:alpha-galactosidase
VQQTDATKTVILTNVRDVLIIYWLFTLEDLMYKVGRLLLRAMVGFLLLYHQAISPSSTAHLHSVTPNQTFTLSLHRQSPSEDGHNFSKPLVNIQQTASWLTTTRTVYTNIHPQVFFLHTNRAAAAAAAS